VGFFVDLAEPGCGEVGVDLCGCEAGVTEHFLYCAKVCAAVEHVCGEGVPEGVGGGLVA